MDRPGPLDATKLVVQQRLVTATYLFGRGNVFGLASARVVLRGFLFVSIGSIVRRVNNTEGTSHLHTSQQTPQGPCGGFHTARVQCIERDKNVNTKRGLLYNILYF